MANFRSDRKAFPVPMKTCPKCDGLGLVATDGLEHRRQKMAERSMLYHLKPVQYQDAFEKKWWPGIAVSQVGAGGWAKLKVFLWMGGSNTVPLIRGGGYPIPLCWEYLCLEGHKLWFVDVYLSSVPGRVRLLETWPEAMDLLAGVVAESGGLIEASCGRMSDGRLP